MSLHIAVLAGGPSPEAEVSRASASAVASALAQSGHRVEVVELDSAVATAVRGFEVVFPVLHGPLGEDGCVQGLLEVLDLPYVGSGVLASAVGASKPDAKVHFRAAALPVAAQAVIGRGEAIAQRVREVRGELGHRVVIKPANGGSALGVTRITAATDEAGWAAAVQKVLDMGSDALVEVFASGSEVTCGVLEDDTGRAQALPPTLIRARAADWYDFTSRYASGGSEHICPAPFRAELTRTIQGVAERAHRSIGARDLSRADFVVNEATGEVTLLEINTMPGMTATSLFPEAAAAAGIEFVTLCDSLVRRAAARPRRSTPLAVPMPE